MLRPGFLLLAGVFMTCPMAGATGPIGPHSTQDRTAYSLGYQIGLDFRRQGVEVRPETISRGFHDAQDGNEPLLGPDEMRRSLLEFKRRITSQKALESRQNAARQGEQDEAFLTANARREGVISLASGLQYQVIQDGRGRRPSLDDRVAVNYRASLTSGVEFDGTEGQPAIFAVKEVVPGWREGLQLMQEGAHWLLFIPAKLGYGVRGPLANKAVILDVELLKVMGPATTDAAKPSTRAEE